MDPFAACGLDGQFRLSTTGELPPSVPAARLDDRRSLLAQFDAAAGAPTGRSAGGFDQFREMAFSLRHDRTRCATRSTWAASRSPCASGTA